MTFSSLVKNKKCHEKLQKNLLCLETKKFVYPRFDEIKKDSEEEKKVLSICQFVCFSFSQNETTFSFSANYETFVTTTFLCLLYFSFACFFIIPIFPPVFFKTYQKFIAFLFSFYPSAHFTSALQNFP